MTRTETIARLRELLAGQFDENELNRRLPKKDALDLSGANLTRADLEGANLEKANLEGADLEGANLRSASFSRVDSNGAHDAANLQRVNLTEADLEGANLQRVNLMRATLIRANLEGANLWLARLEETILSEMKLKGAKLWRGEYNMRDLLPGQLAQVGSGLEWVHGLPPGMFADAVAAGYKGHLKK